LRAGHLPLLSRNRLGLKSRQGQGYMDAGFPRSHGWQSQMVRRVELAGRLDEFWTAHSIHDFPTESRVATPTTQPDDALATVLGQAVRDLADRDAQSALPHSIEAERQQLVPLGPVVHAVRYVQVRYDELAAGRDAVVAERDARVAERDAVVAERDARVVERDAVVVERDAVVAERDAVSVGLRAIESSRVWRSTAWYRKLRAR
jgi:hypothetical protein